jgi:hypothetical protein
VRLWCCGASSSRCIRRATDPVCPHASDELYDWTPRCWPHPCTEIIAAMSYMIGHSYMIVLRAADLMRHQRWAIRLDTALLTSCLQCNNAA